ncbi:hypothetical protein [Chitinimonas lacunae]|uniref:Uncharacterized protein n=1 Tax=Chitinimonas lacunae TaxID=1963018 RepID=A0ABV8MUA8_9NEIS
MTRALEHKPPIAWLKMSFDTVQQSQQLVWLFEQDKRNSYKDKGRYSGTVSIEQYAYFQLSLTGYQAGLPFRDYQVIQAGMVTIPYPKPCYSPNPQRYPPSPFRPGSGAIHLFQFGRPDPNGVSLCIPRPPLQLHHDGLWETSMFLTILFYPDIRPGQQRLFRFDPELEVSNGSQRQTPFQAAAEPK